MAVGEIGFDSAKIPMFDLYTESTIAIFRLSLIKRDSWQHVCSSS